MDIGAVVERARVAAKSRARGPNGRGSCLSPIAQPLEMSLRSSDAKDSTNAPAGPRRAERRRPANCLRLNRLAEHRIHAGLQARRSADTGVPSCANPPHDPAAPPTLLASGLSPTGLCWLDCCSGSSPAQSRTLRGPEFPPGDTARASWMGKCPRACPEQRSRVARLPTSETGADRGSIPAFVLARVGIAGDHSRGCLCPQGAVPSRPERAGSVAPLRGDQARRGSASRACLCAIASAPAFGLIVSWTHRTRSSASGG